MITYLSEDVIEIMIKQMEKYDYYNLKLVNKDFRLMLKTKRFDILYYYFSKEIIKKVFNLNTIKYCTNANCPNKLHCSNIATTLDKSDIDYNSMMKCKDIIIDIKSNFNSELRFDTTLAYQYYGKNNISFIQLPYCEDCLHEYRPEIYKYIESQFIDC